MDELREDVTGEYAGLFQSRPSMVEAVRWTGDNAAQVLRAIPDKTVVRPDALKGGLWLLAGKDGAQEWVPVPEGHWLVHQPGDLSDVWPVEDGYFRAKYLPHIGRDVT